jgi:hypothetical protein
MRTHYGNLKVSRDAPVEVIRASYRALSAKYHPDVNQSEDAARIFRIIKKSYDVLSDPARRAAHDRWIAAQESGRSREPEPDPTPLPVSVDDGPIDGKWPAMIAAGFVLVGALWPRRNLRVDVFHYPQGHSLSGGFMTLSVRAICSWDVGGDVRVRAICSWDVGGDVRVRAIRNGPAGGGWLSFTGSQL